MNATTPFPARATKPQATRLPDGRVAIFIGSAYQFTDDAGAANLRDQLDVLLQPPPATARQLYEQAERDLLKMMSAELDRVECGGCAPPVFVNKAAS